ncbi:PREDICTED: WD repeat-containing protein 74-like [Nicrophorus vespilloides]|uniref:WD repeat-containing protein 74-like n=1 Tax=Nicrophorus vespilloides TaxID=110193 RepID=A0ABM1N2X5_NICVS|nr:PREDICTED: WD repeat-containing protein 74-like [Nicrophorus vespilloides]
MCDYDVYVGTARGALVYSQCTPNVKSKYELKNLKGEVTALEWTNKEHELAVGFDTGQVSIYNTAQNEYTKHLRELEGEGPVVGIGCHNNSFIVGRENGIVNIWNGKENQTFKVPLNEGNVPMYCMAYNKNTKVFATGGENNGLKVWDAEKLKPVFKAASLGRDFLDLHIRVSVRSLTFFPNEDHIIGCATKEGMVLLYDTRVKDKMPVCKYTEEKASYTVIAAGQKDRQCFVGTTKGFLQLIDMSKPKAKPIRTLKCFTGSVTGVTSIGFGSVATICLDRYLRIHNIDTKELYFKEYMKMNLTKIVAKPRIKEEPKEEDEGEVIETVEDREYSKLFDDMEIITEDNEEAPKKLKRKTKTKLNSRKKMKKNSD